MSRLALVYDLRDDYLSMGYSIEQVAEFDTLETIDQLDAALRSNGHNVERIGHGRALAAALVKGRRWDLVFSIAEGLTGRSREAQVPALCELFDQPCVFSDPLTMAVTLDKSVAKRLVRDAGIVTAPFLVIENMHNLDTTAWNQYPAFIKPLAEGTGKGCERTSIVHRPDELHGAIEDLLQRFAQPVLLEAYLPGREFTVGIVGNGDDAEVIGVMEISHRTADEAGVYSFVSKEECDSMIDYSCPADPVATASGDCALKAYRALQCRDAARVDIRVDMNGQPAFIEVNPIAGLHATHSDLPMLARFNGIDFNTLIARIVAAAMQRYGLTLLTTNKTAHELAA
ncbi:MAG: D-alanine-D-alanine ligase [Granulosicoccus sp.]|jgi:D-alanine-D-alanine ligase